PGDIGRDWKRMARIRRAESPAAASGQPAFAHQARHALATRAASPGRRAWRGPEGSHTTADSRCGSTRSRGPIGRPPACAGWARSPGVKAGLLRRAERELQAFSLAKKAVAVSAFFRMSRFICNVR